MVKWFIAMHRKPSLLLSAGLTIHTQGGSVRSHALQMVVFYFLPYLIDTNTRHDLIRIGGSIESVSILFVMCLALKLSLNP